LTDFENNDVDELTTEVTKPSNLDQTEALVDDGFDFDLLVSNFSSSSQVNFNIYVLL
jgi:hypothetical protein